METTNDLNMDEYGDTEVLDLAKEHDENAYELGGNTDFSNFTYSNGTEAANLGRENFPDERLIQNQELEQNNYLEMEHADSNEVFRKVKAEVVEPANEVEITYSSMNADNEKEENRGTKRSHSADKQEQPKDSKRPRSSTTSIELRFLLPSVCVGALMGRRGDVVHEISKKHDAAIKIPDGRNSHERILTVKVSLDKLVECFHDILERLSKFREMNNRHDEMELRLIIHNSLAGGIIGNRGENIAKLRKDIGAYLHVFRDTLPKSTDRVIRISARQRQLPDALKQLVEFYKDLRIDGSVRKYDTRDYDPKRAHNSGNYLEKRREPSPPRSRRRRRSRSADRKESSRRDSRRGRARSPVRISVKPDHRDFVSTRLPYSYDGYPSRLADYDYLRRSYDDRRDLIPSIDRQLAYDRFAPNAPSALLDYRSYERMREPGRYERDYQPSYAQSGFQSNYGKSALNYGDSVKGDSSNLKSDNVPYSYGHDAQIPSAETAYSGQENKGFAQITVSNEMAIEFAGERGQALNQIRQMTGAQIDMAPNGNTYLIAISGTQGQVNKAHAQIKERISLLKVSHNLPSTLY